MSEPAAVRQRRTRRPNGAGSRPWWNEARSRFEVKITDPHDPDQRYTVSARSEDEAIAKAKAKRRQLERGGRAAGKLTVAKFIDGWLDELSGRVEAGDMAPATLVSYRDMARLYVVPAVGSKLLGRLTPGDVEDMIAKMAAAGKSGNTQRLARSTLRRALRRAQVQGLVGDNVASIAEGPKVSKTARKGRAMTVAEAKTLLTVVRGHRFEAAIVLALACGLRRGEALALRWSDIDFEACSLRVEQKLRWQPREGDTPGRLVFDQRLKTDASEEPIAVPAQVAVLLRSRRAQQAAVRLEAGAEWTDLDLVTVSEMGRPVDPNNFRRSLRALCSTGGLGKVRPHDLRHSTGSLLIALGVPEQQVSFYLRHADAAVTRRYYIHPLGHETAAAASAIGAGLFD